MKLKVINIDGKKTSDVEISDKIFSLNPNKIMIQTLIDWQLNHFKPRTAKTTLSKLLKQKITLYGSGRTDAGVHALEQSAHFDVKNKIQKY